MIATGHTSVGTLIGLASATLILPHTSLPAAFMATGLIGLISHYLMDLVPHGHYNFDATSPTPREKTLLLLDVFAPIIGILTLYAILNGFDSTWWLLLAGIGGAQTPDVLDTLLQTGKIPQKIVNHPWVKKETHFHSSTHWHNPSNPSQATNQGGLPLAAPRDLWQLGVAIAALVGILLI